MIGAAKAGTTSLYHYLGQHPQIFMSPIKEPRFFALAGHPMDFRGPNDERIRDTSTTTLVAYQELFDGVRDEVAIGEASTIYLDSEATPAAIERGLPDVKLIAVLRDPAERAYSAFLHLRSDGSEPESDFEAALRDEPRRVAAHWFHYWRYRERGFYHRHLKRYVDRFGPRRIRVYLYEDLERDSLAVLSDIFRFLGVDPSFRPDVTKRYNVSGEPRSPQWRNLLTRRRPVKQALKRVLPERWGHGVIDWLQLRPRPRPPLPPETRARLVAGYREDIRQLEDLIGRDLSAWLR